MISNRFSLKIVGASGQGINIIGEMLNKGLKRAGYGTFAYREYPSLIKGGHATYQIDITPYIPLSSTKSIDLLVVLNRQATKWHLDEINKSGLIIHDIDNPRISIEEFQTIQSNQVKLAYVPAYQLSKDQGGNELTSNIVMLGILWRQLGLSLESLIELVGEIFKDKPAFLKIDLNCAQAGFNYNYSFDIPFTKRILKPNEVSAEEKRSIHSKLSLTESLLKFTSTESIKNNYLLSGNESISLGAINSDVRIYYSYPMTPASSILTFLADHAKETGMIVKQAEDEITAAGMAVGSMHMGVRALTGTSGGGFDLMTEHISLAAITEIPLVVILGQRPGPATGMPTWTTQGDLMLAIFSAHGEYTKCVIAPRDGEDSFYTIQEAFNIAEKYQIPVIVLTDKLIAESIYSVSRLDENKIPIDRGKLVVKQEELDSLTSKDRYKFTEDGVSQRWLPGSKAADFNANSDEHDEEGNVTEESEPSAKMIEKRIKKEKFLLEELPEPDLITNDQVSDKVIKIVSWGSTFGVISDVMTELKKQDVRIELLHFKYLWPLKVEKLKDFVDENTIVIEGNYKSQLADIIRMQTGIEIRNKILKWDGRPFFADELITELNKYI